MYGADVIEDVAVSAKMSNGYEGFNGTNRSNGSAPNGPQISVPADPEAKLLADDELAASTHTNTHANAHASGRRGEQHLAAGVFVRQLRASLTKRALIGSRDRKAFVCQLLLPSILVCGGLLMLLVREGYGRSLRPPPYHYHHLTTITTVTRFHLPSRPSPPSP